MNKHMNTNTPLLLSQRIVQICLFIVAFIGITGGALQMYLGEPETTPRLDNIHRFMAGVYLSAGIIGLWAGITIRQHNTLIFLLALTVFMGGLGRLISMSQVGIPEPNSIWLGYVIPELLLPCVMVVAQRITNQKLR
jgi:hypothetical protein